MLDTLQHTIAAAPLESLAIVDFWRDAGPALWFGKDDAFDARFRTRFLAAHEEAATGSLAHWGQTAPGALALVVLLDQFPRNAFRGTPRMYATDMQARAAADQALRAGHDQDLGQPLSLFLYLPFAHSESLSDQERSVQLFAPLGEPASSHARRHRDIVARFGRFPHRNLVLGRTMLPEEQRFLDQGGYAG